MKYLFLFLVVLFSTNLHAQNFYKEAPLIVIENSSEWYENLTYAEISTDTLTLSVNGNIELYEHFTEIDNLVIYTSDYSDMVIKLDKLDMSIVEYTTAGKKRRFNLHKVNKRKEKEYIESMFKKQ